MGSETATEAEVIGSSKDKSETKHKTETETETNNSESVGPMESVEPKEPHLTKEEFDAITDSCCTRRCMKPCVGVTCFTLVGLVVFGVLSILPLKLAIDCEGSLFWRLFLGSIIYLGVMFIELFFLSVGLVLLFSVIVVCMKVYFIILTDQHDNQNSHQRIENV